MPIYEYQCQKCGRRSEHMQKMADPLLTTCEVCGGELKKLISSPAVQFKGSGWYVTDYARKSSAGTSGSAKGEGGEKGGSSSGEGGKAESKSSGDGGSASGSSGSGSSGSGSSGSGSSGGGKAD